MKRFLALALVCASASPGCYQTLYMNIAPPNPSAPSGSTAPQAARPSGWRHFFLSGRVPRELHIDAARECGGAERVVAIETEQTFVQGLIEDFASYYINIYSPWTGRVVCRPPE
jgi:hypothetical protein